MVYKQRLVEDKSQNKISWTEANHMEIVKGFLKNPKDYMFYPISYPKSFMNLNIFDFLYQKERFGKVNLNRNPEK